jgi:hypothetical protein
VQDGNSKLPRLAGGAADLPQDITRELGPEMAAGDAGLQEAPASATATADVPPVVVEEETLLRVVLKKLDAAPKRARMHVDDAGSLIELRDALAEAKPEDQGSILEQMHRIEALSKQRGKGDSPPVDRRSPYFGHLRLEEGEKRRDVLIGPRSFVEPGGGVQIVDWRNAPVSRLFYRYEEGDYYEENLGDRVVEGEVLARRTVAIVDAELRRVASPQGTFVREPKGLRWRQIGATQAKLTVATDGTATLTPALGPGAAARVDAGAGAGARAPASALAARGRLGFDDGGTRRADRHRASSISSPDPRRA